MNEFNELVKKYMEFDKETLAQLLALKELSKKEEIPYIPYEPYNPYDIRPIGPYYDQLEPNIFRPTRTFPIPPNYGDWVVTCLTN
jgi:hypothetical protein